jgi:hypothetical protein
MMKNYIIALTTAFIISTACTLQSSGGLPKNFSIAQFDEWDNHKQAEFINSLDKKAKMKFMPLFLEDRLFSLPPGAYIVFLRNGEFIYDSTIDEGGTLSQKHDKFFTGRWSCDGDRVIIESNHPEIEFGKREMWDDIWVEKGDVEDKNIALTVHIQQTVAHDGTKKTDLENALFNWAKRGYFGSDDRIKTFIGSRLRK